MNAWTSIGIATLSLGLGACGGKSINYGNGGTNGNDSGSPGQTFPTIAQGADWQPLLGTALPVEGGRFLVGSNPSDVWGTGTDHQLYHFDGQRWAKVTVGAPTTIGDLQGHLASAGPGAVWIANSYGIVRVDASGTIQDHTSEIGPQPNDQVNVDASADMTVVTDSQAAQCTTTAFAFDGTRFAPMPAIDGGVCDPSPAVRGRSDAWVTGFSGGGAHYDGSAWERFGDPGASRGTLIPFGAGKAVQLSRAGSVCPDWCHPTTPPHGETTTGSWEGLAYDAATLNAVPPPPSLNIPAPSDLDPSLVYVGMEAEPAADGTFALVGCALAQGSSPPGAWWGDASVPAPQGTYVVHEWDGTSLHARALTPSAPACSIFSDPLSIIPEQSAIHSVRPLTDGTWILQPPQPSGPSDPFWGVMAVLMRP